ncbi:MAG: BolA/IbaG family iron-sulfur metabolism protein [Spirochaetes bacterium]|nr:BolA/IbaG family iron-sulfur metabolism protein [Spirochaetota bacterium]
MVTTTEIHDLIAAALPDAQIEVLDPMQDGAHFQALVASQKFVGLPLVKQHKLVMEPLKPVLKERLHALQLKTITPADLNDKRR